MPPPPILRPLLAACLALAGAAPEGAAGGDLSRVSAERLNDGEPVISARHFEEAGLARPGAVVNINGPSLIRVPDWIPPERRADPSARYYLYFGDHNGRYIRLAWSERVAGPYRLHRMGANIPDSERGVLDLTDAGREIALGNDLAVYGHIASPDVHTNHDTREIELYFHGPAQHEGERLGQKTFVATSPDGLDFREGLRPVVLGFAYFRVFQHRNRLHAVASRGSLYRAPEGRHPWRAPEGFDFREELWEPWGAHPSDNPFQHAIDGGPEGPERARHFAVHVCGDVLYAFYSRVGDEPERILLSRVDLSPEDWKEWTPSHPPHELLRPEREWEGARRPLAPSRAGAAVGVHELRDPALFQDNDGSWHLLYTGAGEEAIGIAALRNFPPAP